MELTNSYLIYPVSDHAISLDFGKEMNAQTNQRIMLLFQLLQEKNIAGIKDIIPIKKKLLAKTVLLAPVFK